MQTIQFDCPHCNNPMAVGLNLLGRNVRCPHCKAVIPAPTAVPTAPIPAPPPMLQRSEAPAFKPTRQEYDSIFGEAHDEDLFGSRKKSSSVEMPGPDLTKAPPRRPFLDASDSVVSMPIVKPEMIFTTDPDSLPRADSLPVSLPMETTPFEPLADGSPTDDFESVAAPASRVGSVQRDRKRPVEESARSGSGMGNISTVLLLLYAAATTAAVVFLAARSGKPTNDEPAKAGFESIPDIVGEYERADRKVPISFRWLPDPAEPLAPSQKVAMNKTRRFGSLEVTPTLLEFRVVDVIRKPKDGKEDISPAGGKSLVLTLKVKNVSSDIVLYPNDPAFDRRYYEKSNGIKPYNSIWLANQKTTWGGMIPWPLPENMESVRIKGQEADSTPLLPGAQRETMVASLPGSEVHRLLESDKQKPALWRVQLRNDLIGTGSKAISTTTVIGVEFRGVDVQY